MILLDKFPNLEKLKARIETNFNLKNNGKGSFSDATSYFGQEFQNIGNVQDIIWMDINNDSIKDAIVCGYWMPISIFINHDPSCFIMGDNLILELA